VFTPWRCACHASMTSRRSSTSATGRDLASRSVARGPLATEARVAEASPWNRSSAPARCGMLQLRGQLNLDGTCPFAVPPPGGTLMTIFRRGSPPRRETPAHAPLSSRRRYRSPAPPAGAKQRDFSRAPRRRITLAYAGETSSSAVPQ
jgi:hypothetical protein